MLYIGKLICMTAVLLMLAGCSASPSGAAPGADDDMIEYNGIYKKKSELSEETLKWLEWYHSLPEEQQLALSMIPSEFADSVNQSSAAETAVDLGLEEETPSYLAALSEKDLEETAELARYYFTEKTPVFEGVEEIEPADDSCPFYQNTGIEDSYAPGNIIIYLVLTAKDAREGNPQRFISIARKSKSDEWKVINCGY